MSVKLERTLENLLVWQSEYQTDLSKYGIAKDFALDRGVKVLNQLEIDYGFKIPVTKPEKISLDDIYLVHDKSYIDSLDNPATWLSIFEFSESEYATDKAEKPLNLILEDFRIKCGGTKTAFKNALQKGVSANLGGGYHHAFSDQGRGFCAINDIAIAIKALRKENLINSSLVIDLDFHQGDGTARIFQDDKEVFTLSVHSKEGWPEEKQISNLDVEISAGEEHTYLEKTEEAILKALGLITPDLVVFVAGSDPYEKDILPGTRHLNLTLEQMRQRDELVIDTCSKRGLPLSMVFAGGYGPHVWEVHYFAVKHMLETFQNSPAF